MVLTGAGEPKGFTAFSLAVLKLLSVSPLVGFASPAVRLDAGTRHRDEITVFGDQLAADSVSSGVRYPNGQICDCGHAGGFWISCSGDNPVDFWTRWGPQSC
jgi:hypothetical protein